MNTPDSEQQVIRDLTNPAQNAAVLALATAMLEDPDTSVGEIEADLVAGGSGVVELSPVFLEALRAAVGRRRLETIGSAHLSIVWAMYGEGARIQPSTNNEAGQDFLREKVAQMRWLTKGLDVTWSMVACDDGCPDSPSSSDRARAIVAAERLEDRVKIIKLADGINDGVSISPGFDSLTDSSDSRKGGAIIYALSDALGSWETVAGLGPEAELADSQTWERRQSQRLHVVVATDADLSANLAQVGSLAHSLAGSEQRLMTVGQRYGVAGSVLIKENGPTCEPTSTGSKPDKLIVLFRHFVRATLLPDLAHVLDTQAGFKGFNANELGPVLAKMDSCNETFDVELLIHAAQRGAEIGVIPMTFTEDFGQTNFPSVDPGQRHLDMVTQIVDIYDRLVKPVSPATGEAAKLLDMLRSLDVDGYVAIIDGLKAGEDPADSTLFERRWTVDQLVRFL